MDSNWILFGILIGIFLFSTIIVCWQLVMTILEVRGILKTVHELTEEVKPTIHEVNEILRKSNLAMDEAGETYQNLGEKASQAKTGFGRFKSKVQNMALSLQTGLQRAKEVYNSESDVYDEPLLRKALPEANHDSSSAGTATSVVIENALP